VLQHADPQRDIYYSQGPMDVLDHSCSSMGFGGKMCIDGTKKLEEELQSKAAIGVSPTSLDAANIQKLFPEIKGINAALLSLGIPCLILAVEKSRPHHIRELDQALFLLPGMQAVKMALYVEHTVNVHEIADALWRFCNNLDPKRDHFIADGHIGLDGTRKTRQWDGFQRDWPNIIVADENTIRAVDEKWSQWDIGPFIPSPSLRYQDQLYGKEAVVEDISTDTE
jgi:4-hydroxy-3-polyprenylbenzoate decarboxylase